MRQVKKLRRLDEELRSRFLQLTKKKEEEKGQEIEIDWDPEL